MRVGVGRRWERLAVCMSEAVLPHQPPSIKEPLEGHRTVAAQEVGVGRGCVRRKCHFSCPRCPSALNQRPARVGSKLSGWMIRPKFSRSDSDESNQCRSRPAWPRDVHADTVSQVKARVHSGYFDSYEENEEDMLSILDSCSVNPLVLVRGLTL